MWSEEKSFVSSAAGLQSSGQNVTVMIPKRAEAVKPPGLKQIKTIANREMCSYGGQESLSVFSASVSVSTSCFSEVVFTGDPRVTLGFDGQTVAFRSVMNC